MVETRTKEQDALEKKVDLYATNFFRYCVDKLKIKPKRRSAELIPFVPNKVQRRVATGILRKLAEGKPVRQIYLKARQMGVSTIISGIFHWITAMADIGWNTNAYLLSNDDDGVSYIFNIHKIFYEEMDEDLKPMKKYDNRKMLNFENPDEKTKKQNPGRRSEIRVASAAKPDIGSGYTCHLFHGSEIAKWPNPEETMTAMLQAIPDDGVVIYESTAKGVGGYFHEEWLSAEQGDSDYEAIFFAWFDHDEYTRPLDMDKLEVKAFEDSLDDYERALKKVYNLTNDQLNWRRWCIKNKCKRDINIFKQEYPATPEEAFVSSGRGYFNGESLDEYERNAPLPIWRGEVILVKSENGAETAVFEERPDGRLRIYEWPKIDEHYVAGGDVAEGLDSGRGGDNSCGHFMNKKTWKVAAKWLGKCPPDVFGRIMAAIGHYYNTAYLGIEANNHGHLTLNVIRDQCKYPIDMIHHEMKYSGDTDEYTKKLGWRTHFGTKGPLIDGLAELIREKTLVGLDAGTISELRTYIEEDGKLRARVGCKDDQVMSLAICARMVRDSLDYDIEEKWEDPPEVQEFNKRSVEIAS